MAMGSFHKFVYVILCVLTLTIVCHSLYAHSDGAPIGCIGSGSNRYSHLFYAPRSTFTCGNLGCHYQYPIDCGSGKFTLFVVDKCESGQIIDILISFEKTNTEIHGFEIAAQDRYYNRIVGTFIVDDDDTQVIGGGLYVTHTKKGTNRKYWHVKWQAPPADFLVQNPVRFYALGVEGNDDGTAMGDYIYKATRVIEVAPKKEKKQQVRIIKKE
ncbi:MAG: Reeler domain-containing protein [Candidatus Brocadiaceae bacterium]